MLRAVQSAVTELLDDEVDDENDEMTTEDEDGDVPHRENAESSASAPAPTGDVEDDRKEEEDEEESDDDDDASQRTETLHAEQTKKERSDTPSEIQVKNEDMSKISQSESLAYRLEHRIKSIDSVLARTGNARPPGWSEAGGGEEVAMICTVVDHFVHSVGGSSSSDRKTNSSSEVRDMLERFAVDLRLERDSRKRQIDSLSAQLVRTDAANRELSKSKGILEDAVRSLERDKRETAKEMSHSTRATSRVEQQLRVALREAQEREASMNEMRERMRSMQDELAEARDDDETIEMLKGQLEEAEDRTTELLDQAERAHASAEAQKKRIAEVEGTVAALRADVRLKDEDLSRTRESMQKLESVLRQFEKKRRRSESVSRESLKAAEERASRAESRVSEAVASALEAERNIFRTETKSIERERDAAVREARALRGSLDAAMRQLKSMNEENLVDKRLVAKLMMTYFERGCTDEILEIMSRIIGFADKDRERLRTLARKATGGIVTSLFSTISASATSTVSPLERDRLRAASSASDGGNFIDLWAEFLIREADASSSSSTSTSSASSSSTENATKKSANVVSSNIALTRASVLSSDGTGQDLGLVVRGGPGGVTGVSLGDETVSGR
eukprot:g2288.t1